MELPSSPCLRMLPEVLNEPHLIVGRLEEIRIDLHKRTGVAPVEGPKSNSVSLPSCHPKKKSPDLPA
ncbi:hypothetical protein QJS10_CPB15g00962 [Acorus calamus]|uniref:Uncharacterized protein n=1 Tax=Acorus calamus TaxID=4465 RepID=A0AAV9D435_ACOCL|nr:hypothetical protein QJS10_CPB15g00962 [Acorus calamus]